MWSKIQRQNIGYMLHSIIISATGAFLLTDINDLTFFTWKRPLQHQCNTFCGFLCQEKGMFRFPYVVGINISVYRAIKDKLMQKYIFFSAL